MTSAEAFKIIALIQEHTQAAIQNSWKGAGPASEVEAIEARAQKASTDPSLYIHSLITEL